MLVQKISNNTQPKNNRYWGSPFIQNNSYQSRDVNKISFKGDSFDKSGSTESVIEKLRAAQEDFRKIRAEASKTKTYSSIGDELSANAERNKKLSDVNTQLKLIDEVLNSGKTNSMEDLAKLLDAIKKIKALGSDKGFNKIVGAMYTGIKQELTDNFVWPTMAMSKTSEKVSMPDLILLYGPTGTGKSTFSQALAEQCLSHHEFVDTANMTPEEAMIMLKEKMDDAKHNYTKSGDEKKMTFITINEAESMLYRKSPVLEEFEKLTKGCAENYKCILNLTTNHPLVIDPSLLSEEVTPIKIPVMPADRQTCKEIVEHKLGQLNESTKDVDLMVNAFFSKEDWIYSNKNIVGIIDRIICKKLDSPTIKDYVEAIHKKAPTIPKDSFAMYPKNNKELFAMLQEMLKKAV